MDSLHVVTLFDRHCREAPSRPAVVDATGSWSYGQLQQWSLRLAALLRSHGVGPDTCVGLFGQRGAAFAAAALAVWRCGGAYVPVADDTPAARVAHMLAESGCPVVLALGTALPPVPHPCVLDCRIDEYNDDAAPSLMPDAPPDADRLAYVIFTSGSTGTPKGVLVGHETLGPVMQAFGRHFDVRAGDRVSAVANIGFDASVIEFWPALSRGATVHVAQPSLLHSVHGLVRWLAERRITFTWLPTPIVEVMLASPDLAPPATLRVIETAGQRLAARPAGWSVPLENSYGPTETTVIATSGRVAAQGAEAPDIGRPLPGMTIHLLDAGGNAVTAGAVGQIHIGGIGVARGYLNQPALTRERFIADPADPGARLYATGDLGRWNEAGVLEFHGRVDDQVKVRGFRIEPGEIEVALRALPGISQAACVLGADQRLHAFVALAGATAAAPADWRERLATSLPAYMVPDSLAVLAALPVTPNGKVDRRALAAAGEHGTDDDDAPAAAREFHARVRGALRLPALGWRQDMFGAGASSIDTLMLLEALRREGRVLGLRDLHRARTPERLHALGGEAAAAPPCVVNVTPAAVPPALALSCQQRGVWLAAAQDATGLAYQARLRIDLGLGIDRATLARALTALVRRHAILRTRFTVAAGTASQCVEAPYAVDLPELDLRQCAPGAVDAALAAAFDGPLGAPFALDRLPLSRWMLARLPDGQAVLLHAEHHILHDGWSHRVWLEELMAEYAGRRAAAPVTQYADYVAAQHRWLDSADSASARDYWKAALAGVGTPPQLPRSGNADDPRGSVLRTALPPARWAAIEQGCRELGIAPFVLLNTVLACTVARYTGSADLCTGTVFLHRGWDGAAGMLGMTANTVALRTTIAPDDTVAALLARAHERCLDAQHHEAYPFERVVAELGLASADGRQPLFQVFFGLHQVPAPSPIAGVPQPRVAAPLDTGAAKFDLSLLVHPPAAGQPGPAQLLWEYRHASFAPWFVAAFAACFDSLLTQFLASPAQPVAGLACPDAQRAIAASAPASGLSPYARIAAVAAATPTAPAVRCGATVLDYGALLAAIDGRAAQLRELGVRDGDRVGLRLERSADAIAWMVAVQHAGAAYIPLDPAYPEQRLAYIADHAGLRCLVTDSGAALLPAGEAAAASADAAYVIYTSGSTGAPKGVVVGHASLTFFLDEMTRQFPLPVTSRWAAVTSFSFDISILECLLPLAQGATVVLVDGATARDADQLGALLAAQGITHLQATPSTWRALMDTTWQAPAGFIGLCGGEALDAGLAARILGRGVRLYNMYGPTETTIWSCLHEVRSGEAPVPIGQPIGTTRTYVVDGQGRPVPHGAIGELLIGGPGVSQGYLHAPELTAARFASYPACGGEWLYRTGDLVSHGAAGELLFHGRNDHQLKVSGFRIEAEEVERVIASCPGIDGALVTAAPLPGGTALVAYVVTRNAPSAATLRAHCAARLPAYMIPVHWLPLPAWPLTPNGKIDRLALPAPDVASAGRAPCGPCETALAALYRPLFGGAQVSITDGFYMLGGDSALAMRLVVAINAQFGTALTVAQFLRLGSIEALAAWIGQQDTAAPAEEFTL